jgi:putative glutamine amidotransferase
MNQPIIGVIPLWDEKKDSIWMLPGYMHGLEEAGAVRLVPESPLCKLVGKKHLEVNSYHHQGINKMAKGLEAMAFAEDNLIEAVYMPDRSFVWAVQWHPEFSLEDEISKKIFSCFVGSVI